VGPLYYSLYDAACVNGKRRVPDSGKGSSRRTPRLLTPAEVEEMVQLLMERTRQTIWSLVTAHSANGKSLTSLGDTIQIGAAELILARRAGQFTDGQHPSTIATWRTTGWRRARIRISCACSI